jgi:hypothetical protein
MEAAFSFEMLVFIYQNTQHHIPGGNNLHAGFLLGLPFDPVDGGDMLLRTVG